MVLTSLKCNWPARASNKRRTGESGAPAVQAGLTTRPLRMQLVQTRMRRGVFPSSTRTRCRLGFHLRFVRLWAWLIRCPYMGPFPQISHRCAMMRAPRKSFGRACATPLKQGSIPEGGISTKSEDSSRKAFYRGERIGTRTADSRGRRPRARGVRGTGIRSASHAAVRIAGCSLWRKSA
jgi:hypothetical protein